MNCPTAQQMSTLSAISKNRFPHSGSDISEEFVDYVRPLTQGHVELPTKNGIPLFAYRKEN